MPMSYVDVCESAICIKKKIDYISREINVHISMYISIFTRLISLGLRYTVRVAYNVKSLKWIYPFIL